MVQPGTSASAAAPHPPYQYQPLKDPKRQIRLIRLRPTIELSEIGCEIIHEELEKAHEYEALSYVWGSTSEMENLICFDGTSNKRTTLKITRSLYRVIRQLQRHEEPRHLWIDQVCINQEDGREKFSQITIMDRIYNYAKEVILWLGEETEQMKRAIRVIRLLEETSDLSDMNYSTEDLAALNAFFARPWFTRLWVVQEAACATSAVALCGSSSVSWEWIARAAFQFFKNFPKVQCSNAAKMALYGNLLAVQSQGLPFARPLSELFPLFMDLFRTFDCSQKQDRYLALGPFGFWRNSTVDFEGMGRGADPKEFFTFMTCSSITRPGGQQIQIINNLSEVCSAGTRNNLAYPAWPSWVPDYCHEGIVNRPLLPYGFLTSAFNASGRWGLYSTLYNLATPLRVSRDAVQQFFHSRFDPKLTLVGKRVSYVKEVLNQYPARSLGPNSENIAPQEVDSVILQWFEKVQELYPDTCNSHNVRSDFGRMLVADGMMDVARQIVGTGGLEGGIIGAETDVSLFVENRRFTPKISLDLFSTFLDIWIGIPEVSQLNLKKERKKEILEYQDAITECCRGQCLFILENGSYGLCPPETAKGDMVCLFYGGKVPFVLRPVERHRNEKLYTLIGDSYVNGIMYGEATGWWEVWTEKFQII